MPITILTNIFRSTRDSSGTLFSHPGLKRCKSECFRTLQTETDLKTQDEENNAGLCGRSTSLWKCLTGGEGGRLFGLEQAEHVKNYYKKRWVSDNTEKGTTESTLDEAIDTDSQTAGKSLYSQWAASRSGSQAKPLMPLKSLNEFAVSSNYDPFRHQTERIISVFPKPTDSGDGETRRSLDRLKRPSSVPMYWVVDKSPLDFLTNNEPDKASARTKKRQNPRPGASMMRSASSSAEDSADEFSKEKERDRLENEERETAVKKCLPHHTRNRTRPSTTGLLPMKSPDDIPLFDVNTTKKKLVFGGRLGAN